MQLKQRIIGVFFGILIFAITTTAMAASRDVVTLGEKSSAPLSAAVVSGNFIFTSGQIPIDSKGAIPEGIKAQTKQTMDNLSAVIKAAGGDMGNVIKTTVFLKDFDDFAAMNEVYSGYFPNGFPARSTVEVSELAMDVLIEIEAVVAK